MEIQEVRFYLFLRLKKPKSRFKRQYPDYFCGQQTKNSVSRGTLLKFSTAPHLKFLITAVDTSEILLPEIHKFNLKRYNSPDSRLWRAIKTLHTDFIRPKYYFSTLANKVRFISSSTLTLSWNSS